MQEKEKRHSYENYDLSAGYARIMIMRFCIAMKVHKKIWVYSNAFSARTPCA